MSPKVSILVPAHNEDITIEACTQLADRVTGELLPFTDADTMHQPNMLTGVMSAMLGEKADILTGFPRQVVKSWGERIQVPFFTWESLNFIPLWLSYLVRSSVLSISAGETMLFRREAYGCKENGVLA